MSHSDDFSTSAGLTCCWNKDRPAYDSANGSTCSASVDAPVAGYIPAENPNYNQGFATRRGFIFSSFEFHVPLSNIFGFEEYRKVIYGMKHTLTLTRGSDAAALYRNAIAADGKVDITSISWHMPQIQMTPELLNGLRRIIEQKITPPLAFRARTSEQTSVTQTQNFTSRLLVTGGHEKPRWIMVGFQTDIIGNQQQNPAVFNKSALKNANVTLNSDRYPMTDIMTNFTKNEYMKLNTMFDDLKKYYYGIDSLVSGTQVNVSAYISLFSIIVSDVRKQNETLKTAVMDIQLKFEFNAAVPANTTTYSVMISDRFYKLSSDGKSMSVLSK